MICLRSSPASTRSGAFTLLETLVMLATLIAFALLLAGVTKPLWHPENETEAQPKTVNVPVPVPAAPAK